MGKGDRLGEFEAMVLAAIARREAATGPDVYDEVTARTGRDASLAAIHVTLRRLGAKGLVEARVGRVGPQGGRPSRTWAPTPAGFDALGRFQAEWRAMIGDLEIPGWGGSK